MNVRLMAVIALAGGLVGAPLVTAGAASALPVTCDGAGCVPYVDQGVTNGGACVLDGSRYVFGLDNAGNTYVCNLKLMWEPVPPLIGIRTLRAPCDASQPGMAQSPDGLPMTCKSGGWTPDFTAVYY